MALSYVHPLLASYHLVAPKGFSIVFQPQYRTKRAASKGVGQHLRSVTHDEPRVVPKGRRHVANLHPALSFPAQVLNFFGRQVLGSHHRSRTVILLESLICDKPVLAE